MLNLGLFWAYVPGPPAFAFASKLNRAPQSPEFTFQMKRINEKVKDIVEVRKFSSLQDFNADSAATLSAYRFTDATSELMSKWLDKISQLQSGQGHALALAGYRGVGKSHFLATLAAVTGHPDLRTKIGDSHVAASSQTLLRRKYPCVFVRRGMRETLLDELRSGVAEGFGIEESSTPDRIFDLLSAVRSRSGDVPFILLVDTAIERGSRVARDDGAVLAEIAESVKSLNGFIGVALDDDIAGADGSNAAIVRSFNIDYLDQEHLYKVVDSYVFPKNQQLRSVLHDVYEYFREVMPTFRWSEQRFTSLYPLHPAILDVAPFVRLYVNEFALLTFAADAGERIMGRPANSLIALDEVFDSAEADLRKVEELREAFEAYDRLNSDVVAKIPVMQRLQAKLILKALLVLSLEGQGTTAGEISSGTLIFDENDPKKANKTVEEIVRMFAAAMPDDVRVYEEEGREVRYGLKVSSNDGLKQALDAAASKVSGTKVDETIHRIFDERYSDSLFFALDGMRKASVECHLQWRGGTRRGRVFWQDSTSESTVNLDQPSHEHNEWEVLIDLTGETPKQSAIEELPRAVWKAAEMTPDERDAVKRFFALQNDAGLRSAYGEQIRGMFHSHMLILDRIVNRIFLEDGRLVVDGFDYNLSEEARVAGSLSRLFSSMLEPLFEMRFPDHPYFLRALGHAEVSSLVSDLYSGSRQKLGEVQQLAQTFALPLGLVKLSDGVYYPAVREQLLSLEFVKTIDKLIDEKGSEPAELDTVFKELGRPPYGLVREAQQLILAAMVSQRMLEFVTSKGDRINQRSLDLKMIWDDVVGLARPKESSHSGTKLAKWAALLTGDNDLKDISSEADLERLNQSLGRWLADWDTLGILSRFNSVPEECLNTAIWRSVVRASKTLGASAALVRKFLDNQITVDESLGRVSELFLDDQENFKRATLELEIVQIFLDGYESGRKMRQYVLTSCATDDPAIESLRESVLSAAVAFESHPSDESRRNAGYAFSKFQREYCQYYLTRHDSVMRSSELQSRAEEFFKSDEWWMFDTLSVFSPGSGVINDVLDANNKVKKLGCEANAEETLIEFGECTCGYDLAEHAAWEAAVEELQSLIKKANNAILSEVRLRLSSVAGRLEQAVQDPRHGNLNAALMEVAEFLERGKYPAVWTGAHIQALRVAELLQSAAGNGGNSKPVHSSGVSGSPTDPFEDAALTAA